MQIDVVCVQFRLGGKRGAGVRGPGVRGTGYGVRGTGYGVRGTGSRGAGVWKTRGLVENAGYHFFHQNMNFPQ